MGKIKILFLKEALYMREELRLELLRLFRTQVCAARSLEIRESRLSRLLHRWENPTQLERMKFEKLLGTRRARRLLYSQSVEGTKVLKKRMSDGAAA